MENLEVYVLKQTSMETALFGRFLSGSR